MSCFGLQLCPCLTVWSTVSALSVISSQDLQLKLSKLNDSLYTLSFLNQSRLLCQQLHSVLSDTTLPPSHFPPAMWTLWTNCSSSSQSNNAFNHLTHHWKPFSPEHFSSMEAISSTVRSIASQQGNVHWTLVFACLMTLLYIALRGLRPQHLYTVLVLRWWNRCLSRKAEDSIYSEQKSVQLRAYSDKLVKQVVLIKDNLQELSDICNDAFIFDKKVVDPIKVLQFTSYDQKIQLSTLINHTKIQNITQECSDCSIKQADVLRTSFKVIQNLLQQKAASEFL